jgi:Arc/MetJ family transcription regulator
MVPSHRCYDAFMRTTLTLDDDVAAELKRVARRTGRPFKELVNEALRAGLRTRSAPAARRYRLTPSSLGGVIPGVDLDRALRLAEAIEDEAIARKLEMRK